MSKISSYQLGESIPFSFDLNGNSAVGYVCTITVKQYPADSSSITRVIASSSSSGQDVFSGFLTSTETAGLSAGLWTINAEMVNSGTVEQTSQQQRAQLVQSWT
tara:strand:- start:1227 stop:1538 length:312 start_codon:yes stop_codon:yes gene_type:complete